MYRQQRGDRGRLTNGLPVPMQRDAASTLSGVAQAYRPKLPILTTRANLQLLGTAPQQAAGAIGSERATANQQVDRFQQRGLAGAVGARQQVDSRREF